MSSSDRESSTVPTRDESPQTRPAANITAEHPDTSPVAEEGPSTPTGAPTSGQQTALNEMRSTPPAMISTEHSAGQAAQRVHEEAQPESDDLHEEQDPQDQIERFAWDELEGRFQNMIKTRNNEDAKLQHEFNELVKVRLTLSCDFDYFLTSNPVLQCMGRDDSTP